VVTAEAVFKRFVQPPGVSCRIIASITDECVGHSLESSY
jgi:hypothetical protein